MIHFVERDQIEAFYLGWKEHGLQPITLTFFEHIRLIAEILDEPGVDIAGVSHTRAIHVGYLDGRQIDILADFTNHGALARAWGPTDIQTVTLLGLDTIADERSNFFSLGIASDQSTGIGATGEELASLRVDGLSDTRGGAWTGSRREIRVSRGPWG